MAEITGLLLGVAALWETCVQIYDAVDSARHYGLEYELLTIKFEVERYGLQPSNLITPQAEGELALVQQQRDLTRVFKRAYACIRRMAQERQAGTTIKGKTMWAVRDRKRFTVFITELRGFNDSLESLFPGAKFQVAQAMKYDINAAVEINDLQLLQEAMASDHGDLSELASIRLETLGATVSARTELIPRTNSDHELKAADIIRDQNDPNTQEQSEVITSNAEAGPTDVDELASRLKDIELYMDKKASGALVTSISGPYSGLGHVSAHVHWSGHSQRHSLFDEQDKGITSSAVHDAFKYYKKTKFMRKVYREYETLDSEDYVLLDTESHINYENINPGTVTIDGYGLECWAFEDTKVRDMTIMVNYAELPVLSASTILRRLHELQENRSKFGWSPTEEELDLKDVVGTLGITYYDQKAAQDRNRRIGDLYSVLNRNDIFVDFNTTSSVQLPMVTAPDTEGHIGIWGFLRQIIVAWELDARLKIADDASSHSGFTARILASLIVSGLWLKNVQIVLQDANPALRDLKRPQTDAEKSKADKLKNMGNEALKNKEYQKAADLYSEAINIDNGNAVYHCNKSAALVKLKKLEDAEHEAYVATLLDSTYAKAWSRLGMAMLEMGHAKRSKLAYEKSLAIAGKDATANMREGLKAAQDEITRSIRAINTEKNKEKQHLLRNKFLDEDWEIFGKTVQLHSLVHERQVEGLLLFARRMKWPHMNEVRDTAEDVYSNLRGGETIDVNLHDWLYGMMLPGRWFAFKIMAALVLCTPTVKTQMGISPHYDSGVVLPTRSYWRVRTVLGRVLGCLPGVISLCGWIGPCPKVEFVPSMAADKADVSPCYARIKARRIALATNNSDHSVVTAYYDRYGPTRMRSTEEIEPYLAEMRDASNWIVPEPPVRDVSTCETTAIQLKALPLEVNVAERASRGELGDNEVPMETQYRACITFTIDNNQSPVTYRLYTNPVFVTPPPCRGGPHPVHLRELPRFQKNIWSAEQLKDHTADDVGPDDVMTINATAEDRPAAAAASPTPTPTQGTVASQHAVETPSRQQHGKRLSTSGSVRKPATGSSTASGTPGGKGPGRKPRACAECKKQKMKCEVLPGETRCRHCSRRDLPCVLSEGVQRAIQQTLEAAAATPSSVTRTENNGREDLDDMRREIQQLKASMDALVRHLPQPTPDTPTRTTLPTHPPHPPHAPHPTHAVPVPHHAHAVHTISPAATALTLSTREDNTHMAMTRENSVEPAAAGEDGDDDDDSTSPHHDAVAVDEPMGSLYEVTRLRNLRSSRAKTVRPPRDGPDEPLDDFISKGVVSQAEAEQLYATFHTSLNHYLWVGLEQTHPSFASVRKSSELLTATILTVTALHLPDHSGTFDRCYAAFLALIASSMFSRYHSIDDVRGLCIAAFWLSEVSWKLSGHAIRIATELNLHQSFARALDGDRTHFLRARLWYMLYVCDHHFSIAYGRPPMVAESQQIREHEAFLASPLADALDQRILSQVNLMQILTRIYARFSVAERRQPVPMLAESDLGDLRPFNLEIDQWRLKWHARQAPSRYIGTFPPKGIILYSYFAKLQLNSLAVKGVVADDRTGNGLSTERKEFANMGISAAASILTYVLEEEDLRRALVGTPLYVHTMIAFASVFLLKMAAQGNRVMGLNVDAAYVAHLLRRMVELLQSSVTSDRHLLYHIAAGLEKMLAKMKMPSVTGTAANSNSTSTTTSGAASSAGDVPQNQNQSQSQGQQQLQMQADVTQTQPQNQMNMDFVHNQVLLQQHPQPMDGVLAFHDNRWDLSGSLDGSHNVFDSMPVLNNTIIYEAFGSDSANDVYNLLTSQFSY
ncbi:hypothetical protein SBRCBS47491_002371 [Sporothrix bragantina]|uniref:Zn(2)-C6 fungal-type domain-containing protein n=1 Tax=Sporothrix bragantina TaxID=671064 RepID=A0ABP0B6A5_9PEZI